MIVDSAEKIPFQRASGGSEDHGGVFKNQAIGPQRTIDISIIVPVFNEVENLVDLCQGVRKVLTQLGATWEMIFIDDGSTDGSEEALDHLAEEDQRIRIIHFKRNFGQTAAMMAAFDHVVK